MTIGARKCLTAARRLQPVREQAAVEVDQAAQRFAEAVGNHINVCRGQQVQLRDASEEALASSMGPHPVLYEAALACAIDEVERSWLHAKLLGFAWRHQITPGHRKPLADMDGSPALLASEETA